MQEQHKTLKEEKRQLEFECQQFKDEYKKDREQHEQETMLRLKFEEKLNTLHAYNRRLNDQILGMKELIERKDHDNSFLV